MSVLYLVEVNQIIGDLMQNDVESEEILAKIEEFFGFVPKIFQVLSNDPELLKVYFDKVEKLIKNDTLPVLTKEFISIGAAVAAGSEHCLNTHVEVASAFGASEEEILLAILIGASISETAALSKSLRVYEEFKK
jgi:AhpD family alkylhydroperoxidase